jgi:hypothetical protein
MAKPDTFTTEELKAIAARASRLARAAEDSTMRIAYGLLGEAAENVAKRLPREPAPPPGDRPAGSA